MNTNENQLSVLHLYSDTLDLYGDFFNVTCVVNHLEAMGIPCRVRMANLGEDIDLSDADFVYLGHGKARNLAAVAPHFRGYGDKIRDAVEAGTLFLATGNSRLLFGTAFETPDGEQEGIGLFDYTGTETGKVFTGDVVATAAFDPQLVTYGFVNRTAHIVHSGGGNPSPLFSVVKGPGDGERPDGAEGTLYKNFFASWQMGPLLPRNPGLLREILRRLAGERFRDYDDALAEKALALTLKEFDL